MQRGMAVIRRRVTGNSRLFYIAFVFYRPGQGLEALAKIGHQFGIADEGRVFIGEFEREQRRQPGRRRHILARRPGVELALLLFVQEPGQEQPRRIRMRRIPEGGGGLRPDRRRIDFRESDLDGLAGALLTQRKVRIGVRAIPCSRRTPGCATRRGGPARIARRWRCTCSPSPSRGAPTPYRTNRA